MRTYAAGGDRDRDGDGAVEGSERRRIVRIQKRGANYEKNCGCLGTRSTEKMRTDGSRSSTSGM